ncbi:hypothetical protein B566_EDAN008974 [Ephemera danica]|nr:hypothetical protein B566_EDAN008974 [Ephemera danica]
MAHCFVHREEVSEHAVRWGAKFVFFAGAGETTKRCLLEGYDTRHRQDNSMLRVTIRMDMLSGDILFKVPTGDTATTPQPAQEETGDLSGGSIASGSSGFDPVPTILDHSSELMPPPPVPLQLDDIIPDSGLGNHEPGHSRNNSNTSQMSKASGYSSLSQNGIFSSARYTASVNLTLVALHGTEPLLTALPRTSMTPGPTQPRYPEKSRNQSLSHRILLRLRYPTYDIPESEPTPDSGPPIRNNPTSSPRKNSTSSISYRTPDSPRKNSIFSLSSRPPISPKQNLTSASPKFSYGPRKMSTSSPRASPMTNNNENGCICALHEQKQKLLDGAVTNVATMKQGMRCSDEDLLREDGSPTELMQRRKSTPSGSGLSESGGGSLERAKIAAERRKKPQEESGSATLSGKESRVEVTRVNPDDLIAELLQETNFNPDETAENGSTALGSHQVKSETSSRPLKQVVMDKS